MKHMFLPLPVETVRKAWDEWRSTNADQTDAVRLLETKGGCVLVSAGKPPRFFIDLLKDCLAQSRPRVVSAA